MAKSKEDLKSLLIKMKEESEKVDLKLNIQKTKIMASGPITSWQIDVEIVETVTDFILGGFKITADVDCSREIKRHLFLGRKVRLLTNLEKVRLLTNLRKVRLLTNLHSILKSRDFTLPIKVHLVKAMVFPGVM